MARYIFQGTFRDGQGNIIPDGTVTVFDAGTTTASTLYAVSSGGTSVNSVTSDDNGFFCFYVDSSDYSGGSQFDITLSKSGYSDKTYEDVVIYGKGVDGVSVESVAWSGDDMVFTLTDASTITLADAKVDLAGISVENAFTASQQIEGDALLLRLNDTGTSGEEWAIRSDGGNLEIVLNTGTESSPAWTVQARIDVNALRIGNGTGSNIDIIANNDAGTKPVLRYQAAGSKWQYSNDGVAFYDIGGGLPAGGTTGQVLAKTTAVDYDAGWVTPANLAKLQSAVFTGSGVFTFPAGTTPSTVFKFTITGGGAGEYFGPGNYSLGGGAGATAMKWLSGFTAGQTIAVTVGAGGIAHSGAGHGGASTISSGTATITTVTGGGGLNDGTGGTASNGNVNIAGGRGQGIGSFTTGLIGGSSIYGSTGAYGSGGGMNTENSAGRAGTAGIVIVEWVLN